jgi:hypothetical protein
VALRQFLKDAPQGTVIEIYHHSSTLYYDSIGSYVDSIRANYYPGWSGIPMSFCDGCSSGHSVGSIRGDSAVFARWYNARRAVQSPLTITITGIYNRSTRQGRVKATITATAPITVTNLKIHYRLLETLPYHWQTIDTMDNAVRLNFPSISGVPLTISNGQTRADSQAFTMLPGWNMNNVRIAVFVQSDQTREILQGGWAPLTGFSGAEGEKGKGIGGPRGEGFEIIPNPFRGKCAIRFGPATNEAARVRIYDIHGRLVKQLEAETKTGEWTGKDQAGNAVPGGVYFFRLETDGEILTRRAVVLR